MAGSDRTLDANRVLERASLGCVNKPAYRKARLDVQKGLLDMGVARLHVDDPAMNRSAVTWGACFCDE